MATMTKEWVVFLYSQLFSIPIMWLTSIHQSNLNVFDHNGFDIAARQARPFLDVIDEKQHELPTQPVSTTTTTWKEQLQRRQSAPPPPTRTLPSLLVLWPPLPQFPLPLLPPTHMKNQSGYGWITRVSITTIAAYSNTVQKTVSALHAIVKSTNFHLLKRMKNIYLHSSPDWKSEKTSEQRKMPGKT